MDSGLVIYKYLLSLNDSVCTVEAPIVKPLKVGFQRGDFWLWALVDLNAPNKTVVVAPIGTGQPTRSLIEGREYIGTTITHNESLVLHWFVDKM